MNLAILKNHNNPPEFVEKYGDYEYMVVAWFRTFGVRKVRVYYMQEEETPNWDHDFYISTGSPTGVMDDYPWLAHYESVVKKLYELQKPQLGICFGHQMMAKALGSEVRKSEKGWGVGIHSWNFVEESRVGRLIADSVTELNEKSGTKKFSLSVFHQDQVQNSADEMDVFLASDFCPIAGFTVGDNAMAVQGHPEFTRSFIGELMEVRKELISAEEYQRGRESLQLATDEFQLLKLIKSFFKL